MNKKGSTLGLSIIFGITILIVGFLVINFLTGEVTNARDTSALDCSNSSISDGNKLTCLAVDSVVPYFVLMIIAISGGAIISKFL